MFLDVVLVSWVSLGRGRVCINKWEQTSDTATKVIIIIITLEVWLRVSVAQRTDRFESGNELKPAAVVGTYQQRYIIRLTRGARDAGQPSTLYCMLRIGACGRCTCTDMQCRKVYSA
ncbi:hypothetical protein F5Y03DRAFT_180169 [Xylaria venustula]|nr:hypothetical protein F5Y03DRAFT_180169 [Xylaria venustula]